MSQSDDARDAARYRALREMNWHDSPLCVVANPREAVKLGYDCPSEERLDKAIDLVIHAQGMWGRLQRLIRR